MKEQKQKILVVDDEIDLRNIITDILTDAGYETYLAEDGIQGLTLAKTILPDLILCDIQMPSMNGYELLNMVKTDPEMGKVPFVFMTGVNVGQFDLRKGMDLGADDYLTKPFSADDLINAVRTRLRKKQLWQKFLDSKIEKTQTGFIVLLSNELHILVMDILEHAQSLLAENDFSPERIQKTAQKINRSGKRLSRLHENILYYAMLQLWVTDHEKIASFRREVTTSYLHILHSIVHENVREQDRKDSIVLSCTDAALQISPADFGKMMDELVDNACKFSNPTSTIYISSEKNQQGIQLTIRDEGRGMSKEEIDSVESLMDNKQQIYRRDESGLGLTITKSIAELYGGTLTINSEVNKGTSITVTLPIAKISN